MKKSFTLVPATVLACAVLAIVGCGSSGSSPNEAKSASSVVQDAPEGVRVTILDVGKGDCILVQVGGSSALIDTGYGDTSSKVVSYLRQQGVERLDCLVVSHYDKDHVGGISAVGKAFDIDVVYLPGYQGADKWYRGAMADLDDLGLPTKSITEEQTFGLGGASFTILPSSLAYVPNAKGDEGNDNDLSLVVTLTFRGDSYLFTGDLEEDGIDGYLEDSRGQFDVLKMPRHGKKSSNTDDLLADVQPQIAIITDSADDPADKKTLKMLKKAEVDTYQTSVHGTVVVESDGTGGYSVSTD